MVRSSGNKNLTLAMAGRYFSLLNRSTITGILDGNLALMSSHSAFLVGKFFFCLKLMFRSFIFLFAFMAAFTILQVDSSSISMKAR